mmetsp:Transcript_17097/g.12146  ORF Transcript_17097/g.12146 Transcript_17097/m.12146 type:complete len:109 (-) Transcript_17097:1336-1662(-)
MEVINQKYVYAPLAETAMGHTEPYNIYGVIIDASAPYMKNKCLCNLKIIDVSLNLKAAELHRTSDGGTVANTHVTLSCFANNTQDLPLILHVGDIIRFHRVNVGMWNN